MRKLVFMDIASYLPCDLAYAFVEQKNAVTLSPKITNQGILNRRTEPFSFLFLSDGKNNFEKIK